MSEAKRANTGSIQPTSNENGGEKRPYKFLAIVGRRTRGEDANEGSSNRVESILTKYGKREEEYRRVGGHRAEEDKKRREDWKKMEKQFRTSLFISVSDNEEYEDLRRFTRGACRLGYRHIFRYGLRELSKLAPEEVVERLVDVDRELKQRGSVQ